MAEEFVRETCIECGVEFWITKEQCNNLHRCGNTFYCPNGHPMIYSDTDKKKMERLIADRDYYKELAGSRWEEVQHLERQLNSYRGHAKRRRKLQRKAREA